MLAALDLAEDCLAPGGAFVAKVLAGGADTGRVTDVDHTQAPTPIDLAAGYPTARVGVDYSPEVVERTLTAIGADVTETGDGWIVTPPSWRPDLTDKWTLAEEVARIHGLDRIPSVQEKLGELAAVVSGVQAAVLARYVRSSVLEVMREDYIRTARAKGLTPMRALAAELEHLSRANLAA